MAEIILAETSTVSTPSLGLVSLYVDNTTTPMLRTKDDSGRDIAVEIPSNYSVIAQSIVAVTRTYIAGSSIRVPTNKLQIGSSFRWKFNMTKTAAGIAASTIDICVGTAGTTADTARVSFTKPAGTAIADEGIIEILATIRNVGASAVMVGEFSLIHNGNTIGHATIPCVVLNTISAGFDTTTAGLIVGLCITTGAADAITIQIVQSEAWNL